MMWHDLFPQDRQPLMDDVTAYSGSFGPVWRDVISYFERAYQCKPKMTYSCCGMKPGWNLKFQKSNTAFGTWYPQPGAFDVMFTWSYKLDAEMMLLLPMLTPQMAGHVERAEDFMKNGRWVMFCADNMGIIEDYKKMCAIKKRPAA